MSRVWPATLFAAALFAGACTYDFSQFPTDQGDSSLGVGDVGPGPVDTGPERMDGDAMDVDVDMTPDDGDLGPVDRFGDLCDDDSACGGLECVLGICTVTCTSDADCPSTAACVLARPEGVCARPCGTAWEAGRSWRECSAGFACTSDGAGCMPDTDVDGWSDPEDNCPDVPNSAQIDTDGDSIGDACDRELRCAEGHVDGVVMRGPLPYASTNWSTPEFADHWLVAAGGEDGDGAGVGALGLFDGRAGAASSTLPYGARRFGLVQLNADEYVLTPGNLGLPGEFGRLLHLYRDGSIRQGVPFEPTAYEPVLAASAGRLFYIGYGAPDPVTQAPSTRYDVFRSDEGEERFISIGGGDDGVRLRWHVTRDLEGRLYFYSTPLSPQTGEGRWAVVGPDARSVTFAPIVYPDVVQPFDPLLVPAPGGGFFAWDRSTGRGFTFDGQVFTEVAEFAITNPFDRANWISQPSGPALHLIGTRDAEPGMLYSASFYLACMPGPMTVDRDQDGVPDVEDLCPDVPNGVELDTDLDGIGDSCDLDADGDGIPDSNDPSLLDTDNDGVPNAIDDDIDGDGIPNAIDPWPFDTDNDGIRNSVDEDDDGDGVLDVDELAAGTDPLDPLHFPTSGLIAWVESGEVRFAPLHDLAASQVLDRVEPTTTPTSVRFAPGGRAVVLIAGALGVATRVEVAPVGGVATSAELGLPLHGVDVVRAGDAMLEELLVAHGRDGDTTQTDLSLYSVTSGEFTELVTVLTAIASPDISGAQLVFTAQPQGCDDCRSPYVMDVLDNIPRIVAPMVSNPAMIRYNDGAITLLGASADGNGSAVWFGATENPAQLRPPEAIDVTAAVGFADGRVVIAATMQDGDALWLWNGSKVRWHKLADFSGPVTELDWTR